MNDTTAAAPRRFSLALLGLLACLAAPFGWLATLDVPVLRSTGAVAWLLLALGVALGWIAWRSDRRARVLLLALVSTAFPALFAWGFFVFSALPKAEVARALERAPDFTLPDELGREVNLADELAAGPVLLVFYRGHW
jgi:hypothetical protein